MIGPCVAEAVFPSELMRFFARYDYTTRLTRQRPSRTTPQTAVYTDLPAALVPGVMRASIESLCVVSILGVPVDGKEYAINI
jgi:hypothetical protein